MTFSGGAMTTYKVQPITQESGIIEKRGIYFHDPSDFARENLFYPFFLGQSIPVFRPTGSAGQKIILRFI